MNPEITELAREIRDRVGNFSESVSSLSERVDRCENRFEKMDILGSGAPAFDDERTGRPAYGLPFANARPVAPRLTHEQASAWSAYVKSGDIHRLQASMSVGSEPDGGLTVSAQVSDRIAAVSFDRSIMRKFARVERLSEGDAWEEPIEHTEADSGWVGETEDRPETDQPELAMTRIPLHEQYALPKATQKILDTSKFDLGGWLERGIGSRFSRQENLNFTIGDGEKKPRGFATYETVATADDTRAWGVFEHIVSGAAGGLHATLPLDAFQSMIGALRLDYHDGAIWMANRGTAATLRTLKDSTGRFLWQDSVIVGQPPTFLGFPFAQNDAMPAIAANSVPVVLANFQRMYVVVDLGGVRVLRDPFTKKGFVLFYTTKRVGGGAHDYNAAKFLKIST